MEIDLDSLFRFRRGPGQIAGLLLDLGIHRVFFVLIGKRHHLLIPILALSLAEIDGAEIQADGCASFKTDQLKAETTQRI
jgi:hypothetical protein